jgi:hypothetical protein
VSWTGYQGKLPKSKRGYRRWNIEEQSGKGGGNKLFATKETEGEGLGKIKLEDGHCGQALIRCQSRNNFIAVVARGVFETALTISNSPVHRKSWNIPVKSLHKLK